MNNHLFFICPTDHLETIIDKHFHEEKYYITSLGNSINFNPQLVEEINALVETKAITEISFVLSDNNKIIMDALRNENYKSIKGLDSFYNKISTYIKRTKVLRNVFSTDTPLITDCLNLKVQSLKPLLNSWFSDKVKVNAKIYKRQTNIFKETNSGLIHLEDYCLN